MKSKILVTGGTGFIGQRLVPALYSEGAEVTVYSRQSTPFSWPVRWLKSLSDLSEEDDFDVVINLAGESLADRRWSEKQKQRLIHSRVDTTEQLVAWMRDARRKPDLFLSGSAVGFYGDQGDEAVDESSSPLKHRHGEDDFGHHLCALWEQSAQQAESIGVKVVFLRLGVVLDSSGGVFQQMAKSLPFKIVTRFGAGTPYFSWIHRADVVAATRFLMDHALPKGLAGPVNFCAPNAVTYRQLSGVLKSEARAIMTLPVPEVVLTGALGEMAETLLLSGQNVIPKRLLEAGFEFQYPTVREAVAACLIKRS